jgi:NDP-sugar pyrophosphorylase family protein
VVEQRGWGKVPPKALLEVAKGKRIIDLEIDMLRKAGVDNIIMATGIQSEAFKRVLGDGSDFDVLLQYAEDESFSRNRRGSAKSDGVTSTRS